jgi:signal transduction histidine kinase
MTVRPLQPAWRSLAFLCVAVALLFAACVSAQTTGNPSLRVSHAMPRTMVDRQSQSWGTYEKVLVSDGVVIFRRPSLWEQYKWHFVAGTALAVAELVLIVILMTERQRRKRSDLKIERLSGRLLEISEQERHRIARELHDDIVQRLSMICFEFVRIDQDSPAADKAIRSSVHVQLELLKEIITDIHQLSRQLHSSDLDMFGLGVALGDLCRRLSKQYAVEIQLITDSTQLDLNRDVALCFYRVAQEALNNALKHSRSRRIEVRIEARDGTLAMTVRDYGTGFDPSTAVEGLGLAAMRERLTLIEGCLRINSKLGEGTEVTVQAKLGVSLRHSTAA